MSTVINLDRILEDREAPAFIKEAARKILKTGMLSVGEFIKDLSTVDMVSAIGMAECLFDDMLKSQALVGTGEKLQLDAISDAYLLLVEVLSVGEGLDISELARVLTPRLNRLKVFLKIEQIHRSTPVTKIHYDQMSLDYLPDSKVKIIELDTSLPGYSRLEPMMVKLISEEIDKMNGIITQSFIYKLEPGDTQRPGLVARKIADFGALKSASTPKAEPPVREAPKAQAAPEAVTPPPESRRPDPRLDAFRAWLGKK